VKHEFPSKLALVKIDRTAAGYSPYRANAIALTILKIDFPAKILVPADQSGWRETQEADRVRNPIRLPFLDQCRIKSNIRTPFAHTGINNSKRLAHDVAKRGLFHTNRNIELLANLFDVFSSRLKRIAGDVAWR